MQFHSLYFIFRLRLLCKICRVNYCYVFFSFPSSYFGWFLLLLFILFYTMCEKLRSFIHFHFILPHHIKRKMSSKCFSSICLYFPPPLFCLLYLEHVYSTVCVCVLHILYVFSCAKRRSSLLPFFIDANTRCI